MNSIKNLKELAQLAGVSTATVSRALSGSGRISEATRERLKTLAEKLDYEPNLMARNLRTQKTMTVGVIVPLGHDMLQHLSDPFFNAMTGYLADELAEIGYDLLLSRVIPRNEKWLDRHVKSGRSDGIIVIGQSNQIAVIEAVAKRYHPMVVWGGDVMGQHCSVGSDNRLGGMIAARHLMERQCRSIAYAGPCEAPEFAERIAGVRQALQESGVHGDLKLYKSHFEPNAAFSDLADQFRKEKHLPDGIVAGSDVTAFNLLKLFHSMGISVPDQIKVIGYDGLPMGELVSPALTTIDQDLRSGARRMTRLLIDRIKGKETDSCLLTPKLIVRDST